jgi:hypothetical protein
MLGLHSDDRVALLSLGKICAPDPDVQDFEAVVARFISIPRGTSSFTESLLTMNLSLRLILPVTSLISEYTISSSLVWAPFSCASIYTNCREQLTGHLANVSKRQSAHHPL